MFVLSKLSEFGSIIIFSIESQPNIYEDLSIYSLYGSVFFIISSFFLLNPHIDDIFSNITVCESVEFFLYNNENDDLLSLYALILLLILLKAFVIRLSCFFIISGLSISSIFERYSVFNIDILTIWNDSPFISDCVYDISESSSLSKKLEAITSYMVLFVRSKIL